MQTPTLRRALCAGLFAAIAFVPALWSIHAAQFTGHIHSTLIPSGRGNLAVVVPHPDDEVLAAAPFLAAYGRRTTVIAATDGDGFKPAVALSMKTAFTRPRDFERFGRRRRVEQARGLVRVTGRARVPRLIRLGFSDQGLWPMLAGDGVHRSPYTKDTRTEGSSVADGLHQDASALFGALEKTLVDAGPSVVLAPHPSDTHPDHLVLGALTDLALADLEASGRLVAQPVLYRYLVHSGPWPLPKGHHPDEDLAPPRGLFASGTRWYAVPVSPDLRRRMRAAIGAHRTQLTLLRPVLLAFVRKNALAARLRPLRLSPGSRLSWETPVPSPVAAYLTAHPPLRQIAARRSADGRHVTFMALDVGPMRGRTLAVRLWRPRQSRLVPQTLLSQEARVPYRVEEPGPILVVLEVRSGRQVVARSAPRVLTLT